METLENCFICLGRLTSEDAFQDKDEGIAMKLLCRLFRTNLSYKSVSNYLYPVPNSAFCSTCEVNVARAIEIYDLIHSLELELDGIQHGIKEQMKSSYHDGCLGDFVPSQHESVGRLFIQCWSDCQIVVDRLLESELRDINIKSEEDDKSGIDQIEIDHDDGDVFEQGFSPAPSVQSIISGVKEECGLTDGSFVEKWSNPVDDDHDEWIPEKSRKGPISSEDDVGVRRNRTSGTESKSLFQSSSTLPKRKRGRPPKNRLAYSKTTENPGEVDHVVEVLAPRSRRVRAKPQEKSEQAHQNSELTTVFSSQTNTSASGEEAETVIHIELNDDDSDFSISISDDSGDDSDSNASDYMEQEKEVKTRRKPGPKPKPGSIPIEKKYYSCSQCDLEFPLKKKLALHLQEAHDTVLLPTCPYCGLDFKEKCRLPANEDGTVPDRPFACNLCKRTYSSIEKLRRHHMAKCPENPHVAKKHTCKHCNIDFPRRKNLVSHLKEVHDEDLLSTCAYCGLDFNEKCRFPNNADSTAPERPFFCILNFCKRTYFSVEKLRRHHQAKCPENPTVIANLGMKFMCEHCGKDYATQKTLNEHVASKHTKVFRFFCEHCGNGFQREATLKVHLATHSSERPFSCDQCGKTFKRWHQIFYHKRTHTGERPFSCEICGKTFMVREKLNLHRDNVHDDKKIPCHLCGKPFRSKHYLHNHIYSTHRRLRRSRPTKGSLKINPHPSSEIMTNDPAIRDADRFSTHSQELVDISTAVSSTDDKCHENMSQSQNVPHISPAPNPGPSGINLVTPHHLNLIPQSNVHFQPYLYPYRPPTI